MVIKYRVFLKGLQNWGAVVVYNAPYSAVIGSLVTMENDKAGKLSLGESPQLLQSDLFQCFPHHFYPNRKGVNLSAPYASPILPR